MRIFVTGATGYIGNAVAKAFCRAGHLVSGLVRSEKGALELRAAEIEPILGTMDDPKSFAAAAERAQVFVHCASDMSPDRIKRDAETIETFFQIASKSALPRTLLYTSGCWVYGNRPEIVDEASPLQPLSIVKWRPAHENKVLNEGPKNLRTLVIRPGFVYGGTGGYTDFWFASAQKGAVERVGTGENFRSMIHRDDLATAYLLAAEKELGNLIFNINDGMHCTVKQMTDAVAQAAGIPGKIKQLSPQEALAQFGPAVEGLASDQKISNERALPPPPRLETPPPQLPLRSRPLLRSLASLSVSCIEKNPLLFSRNSRQKTYLTILCLLKKMKKEQGKTVNQTFSIPLEISQELHTFVKQCEMSRFVSEAIRKELLTKKEELRNHYLQTKKDKGQLEAEKEWEGAVGDGANEW